ncbi:hypothetical protein ACDY97_26965 [Rhizobium mongolense]
MVTHNFSVMLNTSYGAVERLEIDSNAINPEAVPRPQLLGTRWSESKKIF